MDIQGMIFSSVLFHELAHFFVKSKPCKGVPKFMK